MSKLEERLTECFWSICTAKEQCLLFSHSRSHFWSIL